MYFFVLIIDYTGRELVRYIWFGQFIYRRVSRNYLAKHISLCKYCLYFLETEITSHSTQVNIELREVKSVSTADCCEDVQPLQCTELQKN